jgi:hypothetical protein
MQGRVYDPKLGRFMSADPYITELDNTQNMNRYSYVYNNPLTLTDPNGFQATGLLDGCSSNGGCNGGGMSGQDAVWLGMLLDFFYGSNGGGNAVCPMYADCSAFNNMHVSIWAVMSGFTPGSAGIPVDAPAPIVGVPTSTAVEGILEAQVLASLTNNGTTATSSDATQLALEVVVTASLGEERDAVRRYQSRDNPDQSVLSTAVMDNLAVTVLNSTPKNNTGNNDDGRGAKEHIGIMEMDEAGEYSVIELAFAGTRSEGNSRETGITPTGNTVAILHDHFQRTFPGPGADDALAVYRGYVQYVKDLNGNIYKIEFDRSVADAGGNGWRLTTLQGRNLAGQENWVPGYVSARYK